MPSSTTLFAGERLLGAVPPARSAPPSICDIEPPARLRLGIFLSKLNYCYPDPKEAIWL